MRHYATRELCVCVKHGRWLLANWDAARSIPLELFPEVLDAYRKRIHLLRTSPTAKEALAYAEAVVWSWQTAAWPQEQTWPARTRFLAQTMGLKNPLEAAPRALVTYPETLAVAEIMAAPQRQRRVLETSPRRRTRASPTAVQQLHAELARRTGRPWLADVLPSMAARRARYRDSPDLLQRWLDTCLRTRAGRDNSGQVLWMIPHSEQRPTRYHDRLNSLSSGARPSGIQAETIGMTGRW